MLFSAVTRRVLIRNVPRKAAVSTLPASAYAHVSFVP